MFETLETYGDLVLKPDDLDSEEKQMAVCVEWMRVNHKNHTEFCGCNPKWREMAKRHKELLDANGTVNYVDNGKITVDRIPDSPAIRRQTAPSQDANGPAIWDLVMDDMYLRDRSGELTYGQRLFPKDGRDSLVDAYQEALDLAVYLRKEIYERDGK